MSEKRLESLFTFVGAMFMVCFCIIPFGYMIVVSVAATPAFLSPKVPFAFTWINYADVLSNTSVHFLDYLRNSLVVSSASALFCVVIASLAAYAISRLKFPAKRLLLFFALAVSMFPQIGLVGYLFKMMTWLGWINTYYALVFPYIAWTLPLSLWILVSYFKQIPVDLEEAAMVDGCTRRQVLQKIVFPVALPGIFSVFLLAFISALNEFMFALMLTTDYNARTVPVGIALFQGLHGQTPWGNIMAASVITTLPVVILTLVFQRHIITGLTKGAVKG
jgi:multiple sugar transport system permease protein